MDCQGHRATLWRIGHADHGRRSHHLLMVKPSILGLLSNILANKTSLWRVYFVGFRGISDKLDALAIRCPRKFLIPDSEQMTKKSTAAG